MAEWGDTSTAKGARGKTGIRYEFNGVLSPNYPKKEAQLKEEEEVEEEAYLAVGVDKQEVAFASILHSAEDVLVRLLGAGTHEEITVVLEEGLGLLSAHVTHVPWLSQGL